jgi:hypothetical protein
VAGSKRDATEIGGAPLESYNFENCRPVMLAGMIGLIVGIPHVCNRAEQCKSNMRTMLRLCNSEISHLALRQSKNRCRQKG